MAGEPESFRPKERKLLNLMLKQADEGAYVFFLRPSVKECNIQKAASPQWRCPRLCLLFHSQSERTAMANGKSVGQKQCINQIIIWFRSRSFGVPRKITWNTSEIPLYHLRGGQGTHHRQPSRPVLRHTRSVHKRWPSRTFVHISKNGIWKWVVVGWRCSLKWFVFTRRF